VYTFKVGVAAETLKTEKVEASSAVAIAADLMSNILIGEAKVSERGKRF
jgi:hypothetical protein